MIAQRVSDYGPPSSLRLEQLPDPPLAEGQARLSIAAASVNFPDVLFIAGTYQVRPPPPLCPGFEAAGTIVESRAPELPVGTRVAALLGEGGGYASSAVVTPRATFALPDSLPLDEAAAFTFTYQTGWFGLHRRAQLQPGQWLLVHAGAGGVGSAAIQLGRAAGARVIATCGSPAKVEACRRLGAEVVVDYTREDFVAVVKAATSGRGADVIYDPVGGEVFERSTRCVAFEGRIVVVGFTSGRFPEVRANHVLVKNYSVVGLHWGLYHLADPSLVQKAQVELYRLHAAGAIRPLISERLPLAEAVAAMERVAGRGSIGKIVLVPQSP